MLVTNLKKLVDFNLSILVQVHLIKDFMQSIFVNLDVDTLQAREMNRVSATWNNCVEMKD